MKYYRLNKIDDNQTIVYSISFHSPTEQIKSIEKELINKDFKGKVIFDFLLTNGDTKQRYFETFFDGKEINLNNFKNIFEKSNELKKISLEFYFKNFKYVEQSEIVSKSTKFLIKKKFVINKISSV
ncbi:Antitoxin LsoB [Arcobacter porcinus]|uniref:type II toxin-antitoxin system RnlB family antitoxin n=1 Tax=Arcobacter porcinus TaxID=1935204 RepID=UPI00082555B6|nr:type II toxin-antitoxin system RnlB family antitoxin [Arcobacter porcinus]OCL85167.1 Antitoxin LsoB [Arcobacter porcinus]